MLLNKILFDSDLACYRTMFSREIARVERASLGCPYFDKCYDCKKDTPLDFCEFEDWRRGAKLQYRGFGYVGQIY
jgi:hypothetical protein